MVVLMGTGPKVLDLYVIHDTFRHLQSDLANLYIDDNNVVLCVRDSAAAISNYFIRHIARREMEICILQYSVVPL